MAPQAMAHTISERRLQERIKELAAAELAQERRRQLLERRHARQIIGLWNARVAQQRPASFYPAIGTALAAGTPWLTVRCPGCRTLAEIDLRALDRHPAMPIANLIPQLSCTRCCPHPPFAELGALTVTPSIVSTRSDSFEAMARARRERR
jgi:hypothetical protein